MSAWDTSWAESVTPTYGIPTKDGSGSGGSGGGDDGGGGHGGSGGGGREGGLNRALRVGFLTLLSDSLLSIFLCIGLILGGPLIRMGSARDPPGQVTPP